MADMIHAPWSDDQVTALNAFQASGIFHSYTCAGKHVESVELVATRDGWVCPEGCGYTQDWAHASTADTEAIERTRQLLRDSGFSL